MTTRAVITLVRLAIGRTAYPAFAHSTWPVAASARMPALALTPRGAPVTSMCGPAGGVVAAGWRPAGALAEVAPGDGRAVPLPSASPGAAEQLATDPPATIVKPAITSRADSRIALRGA